MASQPTLKKIENYCIGKAAVSVSYPFDETARVYKVMKKIFVIISEANDPLHINLKCDPSDAQALRAQHSAILPGFHMNKLHWNTLLLDGLIPNRLVFELINHSYDLVASGLSVADRKKLGSKAGR